MSSREGYCCCGLPKDIDDERWCWACRGASAPGMRDTVEVEEHDRRAQAVRHEYMAPTPTVSVSTVPVSDTSYAGMDGAQQRDYKKARQQERRARLRSEGLCARCGKEPAEVGARCEGCREQARAHKAAGRARKRADGD